MVAGRHRRSTPFDSTVRGGTGRYELLKKQQDIVLELRLLARPGAHHAWGRGRDAPVGPRAWPFDKLRTGSSPGRPGSASRPAISEGTRKPRARSLLGARRTQCLARTGERVVYSPPKPGPLGQTRLSLAPLEFLDWLAALVRHCAGIAIGITACSPHPHPPSSRRDRRAGAPDGGTRP